MPSSFSTNLGIELPAAGELDGVWGDVVNVNMLILDRATNGSITLTLSGTSSTLTTSDGTLSDGQHALLILAGTPPSTHTITIAPNDARKIYFIRNTTSQSVIFTQGSGGNATILAGDSAIIYSSGGGASSAVVNLTNDFGMSSVNITGGTISGITDLAIGDGGTGSSTASGARTNLGLGTAAVLNAGTSANNLVQLDGSARLPAVDGSQLTGIVSFPAGGIILWSGSIVSIPAGWALCNGANGTPDLRDRFIVGAGTTYSVNATGGAATVVLSQANLPAHTHTFSGTTSTDGDHSHTYTDRDQINTNVGPGPTTDALSTVTSNTSTAGAHSHTYSGTTSSIGSGTAHENLPPYYALAYIMKL